MYWTSQAQKKRGTRTTLFFLICSRRFTSKAAKIMFGKFLEWNNGHRIKPASFKKNALFLEMFVLVHSTLTCRW